MKIKYNIVLYVACIIALLSFLPWLYDIAFPSAASEPFVAWSPVSECFVVSENGETPRIYTVDAQGKILQEGLTKSDRDSLVPQMYFNQLQAKGALPDSIAGHAIDIPTLKHSQWVFNSLPRDINKHDPGVYPIMESRPKRVELEDPTEVFVFDDGIRFIDMATNKENVSRSQRFAKVLADKGFACPPLSANADITARKAYDEGYLLIDANEQLFHMKMQAGQPYLAHIDLLDDFITNAFILENPDMRHIGLVTNEVGNLYAIERDGYRPVLLPVYWVFPEWQRITIMTNLFNWVIRITDDYGTRWVAIDSDDYSLLGTYSVDKQPTQAQEISRWIFPFRISFTSINDCYAYPRISDFSLPATLIWLSIIAIILLIKFINYKKSNK